MLFRLVFDILKKAGWIISILAIVATGYFIFTQYQAVKNSPLGSLLPNVTIPALQSLVTTPTDSATPTTTPTPIPANMKISIDAKNGPVIFSTEVASTSEQQSLGLMYRTSLPPYAGMYFIYPTEVHYGFWMKNCEIPLDILFINAQKTIVEIKENVPPCKKSDPEQKNCPSYVPKGEYITVLEINSGLSKVHGIAVGQKITESL